MADILEEQRQKFIAKFGREPGPEDEIFFDMPPLEHVEHETVEAMKKAGLDPAFIYAYEKTGLIVTEDNQHLLSNIDLDEWQAAIEEYDAIHAGKGPPKYPIGTLATYGPDDKTVTKLVAGVFLHESAEAIIERWVGIGIVENSKIQNQFQEFFSRHGVKSVAASRGRHGLPARRRRRLSSRRRLSVLPVLEGQAGKQRIVLTQWLGGGIMERKRTSIHPDGLVLTVMVLMALVAVADEAPLPNKEIDATSLRHKVLCGYQGWFRCPGDPVKEGWRHWSRDAKKISPDTLTFEMWPRVCGTKFLRVSGMVSVSR